MANDFQDQTMDQPKDRFVAPNDAPPGQEEQDTEGHFFGGQDTQGHFFEGQDTQGHFFETRTDAAAGGSDQPNGRFVES